MNKSPRTFRIAQDLSNALDQIHKRQGDHTYHVEQALRAYPPIKKILKVSGQGVALPAEKPSKRFEPPLFTEVYEYFSTRGYGGCTQNETQSFMDFYESKGWMVGKNKMKSWQPAVRNWIKRNADNKKPDDKGPMSRLIETGWADDMIGKTTE